MSEEAKKLAEKYGYWTPHPDWPVEGWQRDVSENYTRLSYWDWVLAEQTAKDEKEG